MSYLGPVSDFVTHQHSNPRGAAFLSPRLEIDNAQFLTKAAQTALLLQNAGVQQGDRVVLRLSVVAEAVAIVACMSLGLVSCHYTKQLSPDDYHRLGFRWILTGDAGFESGGLKVLKMDLEENPVESLELPTVGYSSDLETTRIIFSSGTTGTPKPIPFTLTQIRERSKHLLENVMNPSPFYSLMGFDVSLGYMTYMACLFSGKPFLSASSVPEQLALASQWGVGSLGVSPLILETILKAPPGILERMENLRKIYSTGGQLPNSLHSKARQALGVEVVSLYGSTEVGFIAERSTNISEAGDVGNILNYAHVEIVDQNDLPLPEGKTGSIRVQTPWMATKYEGDDSSSVAFRGGYFYPGDRGRLEGNRLFIDGRDNLIVNSSGLKIDPSDVEAFCRDLPEPVQSAGFEHTTADGSSIFVLAVESLQTDLLKDLTSRLNKKFGPAAPRAYFVVSELPRNSLGKPLRKILSKEYSQQRDRMSQ